MDKIFRAWLAAGALITASGRPAAAQPPAMRAGVSVELAVTRHAVPMPDADKDDALILAVTAKGQAYVGTARASAAELADRIRDSLSGRAGKKVYIKGDARAAYADVAQALEAARRAGIEAPSLLAAQRDTPEPAYPVPPKGLEVRVGPPSTTSAGSVTLQAAGAGARPTVSLEGERVALESLEAALDRRLKDRAERTVTLRSDGQVPFGEVVRVIDTCRAAGVKVVLATPGL